MRLLFVGMADSVHTARWINQVTDQGWDVHLFSARDFEINRELKRAAVHDCILRHPDLGAGVQQVGAWPCFIPGIRNETDYMLKRLRRSHPVERWIGTRGQRLARLIDKLKPDIVHALEFQSAGYLTLEARRWVKQAFPPWIVTNWGSDIYLFGRLAEHVDRIKALLATSDYYWSECERDVELAREYGFKGEVLPVLSNVGGLDLGLVQQIRPSGPPSARRLILLKGYQTWAGRALVGLRALELCAPALQGYRVAIYLASPEVKIAAELTAQSIGIPIEIIPICSHEEILRWHGQARISIGLSISDAISQSFLEAMAMGSFPIQSNTSCGNEWAVDGETALFVPPDDAQAVATAICRALADDALMDQAAEKNHHTITERLDRRKIQNRVVQIYQDIAGRAA
jgi:hypothetical protein